MTILSKVEFLYVLRDRAAFMIAAWILPNAKVLDIGALHHIDFVLENPRKFGLTLDDIKGCVRYGEDTDKNLAGITTYLDGGGWFKNYRKSS